jgi:transcriptional regulator with XRE-family HTH domain
MLDGFSPTLSDMDIGHKIRAARDKKQLTVRELGKMIGVSGSAISQWENNQTKILVNNIINLAEALDIPVLELLPEALHAAEITIRDPEERLLIERFRLMPKPLRETYLRLVVIQSETL